MRLTILISILLLVGVGIAAVPVEAAVTPTPGHALVMNNLYVSGTECMGTLTVMYALLTIDSEKGVGMQRNADCSVNVDKLAPKLVTHQIGTVGDIIVQATATRSGPLPRPYYQLQAEIALAGGCPIPLAGAAHTTNLEEEGPADQGFWNKEMGFECWRGYSATWPSSTFLGGLASNTGVVECVFKETYSWTDCWFLDPHYQPDFEVDTPTQLGVIAAGAVGQFDLR